MNKLYTITLGLLMVVAMAGMVAANPVFTSAISNVTVNENVAVSFTPQASAADNGTRVFGISPSLSGASFNTTSGAFSWTPSFSQSGTYDLNVTVQDDNSSDSQIVRVVVNDVSQTSGLVLSSLSFGSADQDRDVNVSKQLTITNNGTLTVSGLAGSNTLSSEYRVQVSNFSATSLAPGVSATATVTITVPESLDAVDANLVGVAVTAGSVVVSGTTSQGAVSASTPVTVRASNELTVEKVVVMVDDEEKRLDDGDDVDELKPGQVVRISIDVENHFRSSSDIDMRNVVVKVASDDDEIGFDDDDDDIGTLSAGDSDTVEFDSFTIEDDADGVYTFTVSIEGTDDNGAKHGEVWKVDLKVEKDTHDVVIRSATLTPSKVSCGKLSSDLRLQLANIGERDEDDVAVSVSASALNYSDRKEGIVLDEGDTTTKTFSIAVPSGTVPGTYPVEITSFYRGTTESDSKSVSLTVEGCDVAPAVTPPVTPTTPPAITGAGTTGSGTGARAQIVGSGLPQSVYIAGLVVGIVVALSLIGLLFTHLFKGK